MSRGLTVKGEATRRRIVEGAAALIREHGVDQVGLDDVCAATKTSKSQLFHYFADGRSELLRAVAAHESAEVLRDQQPFLDDLGPARTWRAWRDVVVRKYLEQGNNCPLSALTRQLGPSDPRIRPIVAALLTDWNDRIAAGVRRAQALDLVDSEVDPARAAATVLAAIQGGVVLLQATGSISYLEEALDAALLPLGVMPKRTGRARH